MPVPLDVIARLPLAPLLAAQAVAVRRAALILPEPPGPPSRQGRRRPAAASADRGRLLGRWGRRPHQDAALSGQLVRRLSRHVHLTWRLEAATGETTRDAIDRLKRLDAGPFDVAILALGVNDVTHGTTRRGWIAGQRALHDLLRTRFGVRRIIASGLPPMGQFPVLPQPLRWIVGRQAQRFDIDLARMAGPDPDSPAPAPGPRPALRGPGWLPSQPGGLFGMGPHAGRTRPERRVTVPTNNGPATVDRPIAPLLSGRKYPGEREGQRPSHYSSWCASGATGSAPRSGRIDPADPKSRRPATAPRAAG
ncbi:SGNH/GDSL hydrolase family protein [Jhaorihella thermophila]